MNMIMDTTRARWIPVACLLLGSSLAIAEPKPAHLVAGYEVAPASTGRIDAADPDWPAVIEPRGALTLRDAVGAALLGNPALAKQAWEARVREALALQADLRPNPALSVEVENLGGTGDRSGVEQTETTIGLSQLVLLGGKRARRRELAEIRSELARWDYEVARVGVLTATAKAFVATLAAQQRVVLLDDLDRAAAAAVAAAAAQVAAGAAPAAARSRAELLRLSIQLDRQRAARALAAERVALSSTWGTVAPQFAEVRGDLRGAVAMPPPLASLEARTESNPDLGRWATELAEREAVVSVERSGGTPDPTVGLGGRHYAQGDDVSIVLSVSVPIPVFDRNQGNVLAAARDLHKARAQKAAAALAVRAELAMRYQDLLSAHEQAETLRASTLPAARVAFEQTQDGYRNGVFGYIDVLDAQRTLYQLQVREIDVLADYHQARADIERLLGEPLTNGGPSS
jgi:cobalt-zinc-cadmium efflux system outer membrane protein